MQQTQIQSVREAFPELLFTQNEPLAKHTYFQIGGPAELYTEVSDKEILARLIQWCSEHAIPWTMLGGASNILILDSGISGLVILNKTQSMRFDEMKEGTTATFDSGVLVNIAVRESINRGLAGLEWFMGLPGTIGGAIVNNAHFTTQLIGDITQSVEVVWENGKREVVTHDQCKFSYDYSIFHESKACVLSASLLLVKGNKENLEQVAREAVIKRSSTQPIGKPCSGCTFKNVTDNGKIIAAGMLIDQCNLKGYRIGGAEVSTVHANFIVNTGNATAQNVLDLAEHIRSVVLEKTGYTLEKEIFVLGNSNRSYAHNMEIH